MVFNSILCDLINDTKGSTAIEYTLIATGISFAIALIVFTFGAELVVLYNSVVDVFTD